MNRRQLFDLGDAVAILGPDADGLACLCIVQASGPEEREPRELWIFGKQSLRVLGEIALAAQRFQEDEIHSLVKPAVAEQAKVLAPPIDNGGEVT